MTEQIPEGQSQIWGDIIPGTIFWEDVTAPENQNLLEGDMRARKLDPKRLKKIRHKMAQAQEALALWEYKSYSKRKKYCVYQIRRLQKTEPESEQIAIWQDTLEQLKLNPPTPPELSFLRRFLARWFMRFRIPMIRSEKIAQKIRLQLAYAQKRLLEHETAIKNEAIYEELAYEMQMEVGYFGQQLIQRWSALANREEYYQNGKRHVRKVQIEECHYTPDEIQYKIKVSSRSLLGAVRHHLPDRVTAWNLVKPETLSELSAACERPVSSPHDENTPESFENGAWIVVYREGLTDGLFDFVEYERVITKYDHEKHYRYPIPLGVKRGRIVQWLYLSEHPHLMVNGIPGSGKTNAIRGVLTTLCEYHSPNEIRFFIVDLKRGGDFREYSDAPHLAAPIITKISDLVEIVPRLVALMQKRMDIMFTVNARDIGDYNARIDDPAKQMPRVVIVIDECNSIDNLANNKADRDTIWRGLTLIATQARAAGIHLLLGTQQSFSDSIPKSVRDNITFVLSGRQRTLAGSLATFGRGVAKTLPNIRGRMWCDDGGELFQLQTPYVSKVRVYESVQVAVSFGQTEPLILPELDELEIEGLRGNSIFTYEDVARIAIEEFDGVMSYRKIHALEETPQDVSQRAIGDMIQQIVELGEIEYDSAIYTVAPYGKGYQLVRKRESAKTQEGDTALSDALLDTFSLTTQNLQEEIGQ